MQANTHVWCSSDARRQFPNTHPQTTKKLSAARTHVADGDSSHQLFGRRSAKCSHGCRQGPNVTCVQCRETDDESRERHGINFRLRTCVHTRFHTSRSTAQHSTACGYTLQREHPVSKNGSLSPDHNGLNKNQTSFSLAHSSLHLCWFAHGPVTSLRARSVGDTTSKCAHRRRTNVTQLFVSWVDFLRTHRDSWARQTKRCA